MIAINMFFKSLNSLLLLLTKTLKMSISRKFEMPFKFESNDWFIWWSTLKHYSFSVFNAAMYFYESLKNFQQTENDKLEARIKEMVQARLQEKLRGYQEKIPDQVLQ